MKVFYILLLLLLAAPCMAQEDAITDSTEVEAPILDSTNAAEQTANTLSERPDGSIDFSLNLTGGANFNSVDQSEEDQSENLQWTSGLRTALNISDGLLFELLMTVFAQYGQLHEKGSLPEKTKDNLILTVMPSWALLPGSSVRVFFETTGETTMGDGDIDDVPTKFLDPLFLYQTVFLGQKQHSEGDENNWSFDMIYGLGYAFQQTIAKQFVLEQNRDFVIDENNPITSVQDQVSLESGYSAVFQLDYTNEITELFNLNISGKTVAMTKTPAIKTIDDSRVSSLVLAGLSFSVISIDYTLKMTYDKNYSLRRQLDQGLVMGLKLKI